MGFELGNSESSWAILKTPGPILALLGIVVLTISFVVFGSNDPGTDIDAMIEANTHGASRFKSMIGMVVGVVLSIAGVLWSLLTFSRR